jgi:hypothetical protein
MTSVSNKYLTILAEISSAANGTACDNLQGASYLVDYLYTSPFWLVTWYGGGKAGSPRGVNMASHL